MLTYDTDEPAVLYLFLSEQAYCLKQLRINGDEVRLLKAFPGSWQVFVARGLGGNFECVLQQVRDFNVFY